MNKLYKGILITGVVLLTLGVGAGSYIASTTCFRKYEQTNHSLKTWMKNINDETKINEIILPGSHDAGTNGMSWLGATQHLSVEEQLNLGVRYFDLRVNKVNDEYFIFHSIINGNKFDPILDLIVNFIKENQSETLLLDFQHFKNGSDEYVCREVSNKLKDYLIIKDEREELNFVDNLKLKEARGKCIVFFGDDSEYTKEDHIFSRNNDTCTKTGQALDSCYISSYHSLESSAFINKALDKYVYKIKEKREKEMHKGIFVLQCQLTDSKLVFGPFHRERSHEQNMENYIKNLANLNYFLEINVIMRDFLDENKANSIINLNYEKGIMK